VSIRSPLLFIRGDVCAESNRRCMECRSGMLVGGDVSVKSIRDGYERQSGAPD
jgi:hypothetical protein